MSHIDLTKQKELLQLCKLEQSILTEGKINSDEEGYFPSKEDEERVKDLYTLQEKYSYGWYIATESLEDQIKSINKFKEFIIELSKDSEKQDNEEELKFTWTDKEDEDLVKNGITVLWALGRTKSIQKFVEDLSYKIGYKCDWSWSAGRAHIEIPKEAIDKYHELIDYHFIAKYIVEYSEETYNNENYFKIIS